MIFIFLSIGRNPRFDESKKHVCHAKSVSNDEKALQCKEGENSGRKRWNGMVDALPRLRTIPFGEFEFKSIGLCTEAIDSKTIRITPAAQ